MINTHQLIKKILLLSVSILLFQLAYAQSDIYPVLDSIAKNNKALKSQWQIQQAKIIGSRTGIYLPDPTAEYDYMIGYPAGAGNQTDFNIIQSFDFPTTGCSFQNAGHGMIARELTGNGTRFQIRANTNSCSGQVFVYLFHVAVAVILNEDQQPLQFFHAFQNQELPRIQDKSYQ